MIGKWLFIAGALPLLTLGILHNIYMLMDLAAPRRIVPRNKELIAGMKASTLRLTQGTDMWRAWIGFNFSHGMGVMAISAFYLYMAIAHFEILQGLPVLLYAAPVLAGCYAVLAWLYWFKIPLAGAALSTGFFLAAVAMQTGAGA